MSLQMGATGNPPRAIWSLSTAVAAGAISQYANGSATPFRATVSPPMPENKSSERRTGAMLDFSPEK
jgi:hypothetical protein